MLQFIETEDNLFEIEDNLFETEDILFETEDNVSFLFLFLLTNFLLV